MAVLAPTLARLNVSRRDKRAMLFLAAVVLLFFAPFFTGRFYATGDMRTVFIPLESFFHASELRGQLPSWDPDAAWGFPVIAAAQIGFFYPPLLLTRWLPLPFYLPLLVISHFLALSIGLYALNRTLRASPLASVLGAVSFTFGTFVLQHVSHLNIMLVIAWLPWQLLAVHRSRNHWLVALLLGTPFLAGQLQVPFMLAVFSCLYLFVQWRDRPLSRRCASIAIIAALVFGIAAAQLLPTLELARQSSRGSGGDFSLVRANQFSFPLYHLPTVLFPYFFGNDSTYWGKRLEIEYGFFIGTLPLLLAAWAFLKRKWPSRFWPVLAAASFLLALGSLSPFRLVGLEPSLWVFSAPTRWLLLTTFCLSIMAAHLFDTLPATLPRFLQVAVAIVLGIVAAANVFLFLVPIHTAIPKINALLSYARHSSVSVLQPYTFLPIGIMLALCFFWRSPHRSIIFVGLAVVELLLVGWHVSPLVPWPTALTPPSTIAALPSIVRTKQARLISERTGGDTGAYFTDPSSRATAATRAQETKLLVPLVSGQFNLAGVEWPASLDLKSQDSVLAKLRPEGSYQITNSDLARELNIGAVVAPIGFPAPTGAQLLATNEDVAVYGYDAAARVSSTSGTAVLTASTATSLHIAVHNSAAGSLVIRDTYFPGWVATIDNAPAPVQPYLSLFRLVAVPAGDHTVTLSYQPQLLVIGLAGSVMAILGCFIMVAWRL